MAVSPDSSQTSYYSNIPIPDPSLITTEQINRAREELRLDTASKLSSLREIIQTRLDGVDRVISLHSDDISHLPRLIEREVQRIAELFDEKVSALKTVVGDNKNFYIEKFSVVQNQFQSLEEHIGQDKLTAASIVATALSSQDKLFAMQNAANAMSIAKSESGFNKEIDALKSLVASNITDLTNRITRVESTREGAKDNTSFIIGLVGAVVGIAGIIIAVMAIHQAPVVTASQAPPPVVSPSVTPR